MFVFSTNTATTIWQRSVGQIHILVVNCSRNTHIVNSSLIQESLHTSRTKPFHKAILSEPFSDKDIFYSGIYCKHLTNYIQRRHPTVLWAFFSKQFLFRCYHNMHKCALLNIQTSTERSSNAAHIFTTPIVRHTFALGLFSKYIFSVISPNIDTVIYII